MGVEDWKVPYGAKLIEWPFPFNGIHVGIGGDPALVKWIINVLMTCGHDHNFAVQMDGNIVHVSKSGQQCIGEAISHERRDEYAELENYLRGGEAVSDV